MFLERSFSVASIPCFLWLRLYNRLSIEAVDEVPAGGAFMSQPTLQCNLDPSSSVQPVPKASFYGQEELFRIPLIGPLFELWEPFPFRARPSGRGQPSSTDLGETGEASERDLSPRDPLRDGRLKGLEGGVALWPLRRSCPHPGFYRQYEAMPAEPFPSSRQIRPVSVSPLRAAELLPRELKAKRSGVRPVRASKGCFYRCRVPWREGCRDHP